MPTRDPAEAEALQDLLERVRAAKGPDRRLDYELFVMFADPDAPNIWDPREGHFYTASIDAARALLDRVLPNADYEVSRVAGRFFGKVRIAPLLSVKDEAESEALALLAALLGALTAQLALTHQEASHVGR